MNEELEFFLAVGAIIVLLVIVLGFGIVWSNSTEQISECEKLDSYGYVTKLEGNFFTKFCKIKTQRGVWINSYDFDITMVERFELK